MGDLTEEETVKGKRQRRSRRRRRRRRRRKGRKRRDAEAVAAAAVTSRLVFLITPDPGRVEEEELLSDVSIMTRLCTEIRIVYPARKTSTARREDEGKVRLRLRTRLGPLPAQGAGWKS